MLHGDTCLRRYKIIVSLWKLKRKPSLLHTLNKISRVNVTEILTREHREYLEVLSDAKHYTYVFTWKNFVKKKTTKPTAYFRFIYTYDEYIKIFATFLKKYAHSKHAVQPETLEFSHISFYTIPAISTIPHRTTSNFLIVIISLEVAPVSFRYTILPFEQNLPIYVYI